MNYTCPICDIELELGSNPGCRHEISAYLVYVWWDGVVDIFSRGYDNRDLYLMRLRYPKRLNEKYIEIAMLLK